MSIPMRKPLRHEETMEVSDDPDDKDLPLFMQKATHRITKVIKANQYEKHSYEKMVDRCDHLNDKEKSIIKGLFNKFKDLFSG